FGEAWVKNRPVEVVQTIFWGSDFNSGVGRIVTMAALSGILGILAWLSFLLSVLWFGAKPIITKAAEHKEYPAFLSTFVGVLFLVIMELIYVPDTVVGVALFMAVGLLLAMMVNIGLTKKISFNLFDNPKLGFVSSLLIVILIVGVVAMSYGVFTKLLGAYQFNRGYAKQVVGDLQGAEMLYKRALKNNEIDQYYRGLVDVNLVKMRQLLSAKDADPKLAEKFKEMLATAFDSGRKATEIGPTNYLNWVSLGMVGEFVVPLKQIQGAYDLAVNSYTKVKELNATSPIGQMRMARLDIAAGNVDKAKLDLLEAIKIKSNFTEALFLLSQIEASKGNLAAAIDKVDQAALFSPNDVGVLFQQGFLKYSKKDYKGAVAALERAVTINNQYSNARYFLGLSYAQLDQQQAAIDQFVEIAKYNSDNEEVKTILENLRAGRQPFEGSKETAPEKRSKLPVKEEK
ncbi:MAG: tetratricopeptide repeat protein, partial [Candidatus Paceibacterota bacterium]